jgi:hypothetical protein
MIALQCSIHDVDSACFTVHAHSAVTYSAAVYLSTVFNQVNYLEMDMHALADLHTALIL